MTGDWQTTPDNLEISTRRVDVWLTSTELAEEQVLEYKKLLSGAELARAEKLAVAVKYKEFVVTRGLLKQMLSKVTGLDVSALHFNHGEHGKPCLAGNVAGKNVVFNVSHSHGMALVAITLGNRLGIDLEKLRQEVEWQALARRFFSDAEFRALSRQPDDCRMKSFFTCWTRKEAFVKAVGNGIAYGLKEFDVSIDPGGSAGLLNIRGDSEEAADWVIKNIPMNENYAAALAVDRPGCDARLWKAPRY